MSRARNFDGWAVWKFPVPQGPVPTIATVEMPEGAEIIRVGQQDDVLTVWALVNLRTTRKDARQLLAVPTGIELWGVLRYLGTTAVHDDEIVVHVFEAEAPDAVE